MLRKYIPKGSDSVGLSNDMISAHLCPRPASPNLLLPLVQNKRLDVEPNIANAEKDVLSQLEGLWVWKLDD